MKSNKILGATLAASLFLVACGNDSKSADSSKFVCDVQETLTTVIVIQEIPDSVSYKEIGTLNGSRIDFVQELYYNNSKTADEICENTKEEAAGWLDGSVHVTCSGNRITRTDYSETTDIAGYAAKRRAQCDVAMKENEQKNTSSVKDDFYCKVTSAENSVKMEMYVRGFVTIVSKTEKGNGAFYTITEESYEKFTDAEEQCRLSKEYAGRNDLVTCSGKKVTTEQVYGEAFQSLSLDFMVDGYQEQCDKHRAELQ